jgi:hypothetical protein
MNRAEFRAAEQAAARRTVTPGDDTIAGYWMMHGYSQAEALQIERDQIRAAIEQEELYDAMERDVW